MICPGVIQGLSLMLVVLINRFTLELLAFHPPPFSMEDCLHRLRQAHTGNICMDRTRALCLLGTSPRREDHFSTAFIPLYSGSYVYIMDIVQGISVQDIYNVACWGTPPPHTFVRFYELDVTTASLAHIVLIVGTSEG